MEYSQACADFEVQSSIKTVFACFEMVRSVGVEPTRLAAPAPKAGVSASSTTTAYMYTRLPACLPAGRFHHDRLHAHV